jgi:hypothetical protein
VPGLRGVRGVGGVLIAPDSSGGPFSRDRYIDRFSPEPRSALRLFDISIAGTHELHARARLTQRGVRYIGHLQRR